jgi:hypothetical protein
VLLDRIGAALGALQMTGEPADNEQPTPAEILQRLEGLVDVLEHRQTSFVTDAELIRRLAAGHATPSTAVQLC